MMIRTANQQYLIRQRGGYVRFLETEVAHRWPGARVHWQTRGSIPAEIVASDWRVSCPCCREAIVIEPPHPWFCPNCLMAWNDGCAMDVIMPDNRAAIEQVLLVRPNPVNRNWLPGETVDMLIAENLEHGLPSGLES